MDPVGIDLYADDRPVDWTEYLKDRRFCFAIFKLSQGLYYESAVWAHAQRQPILASPRYGVDMFDGFYHYLDFSDDPIQQAERYWQLVTNIGGEKAGTLWAMLDVERGGQHQGLELTKSLVEGHVNAWAERYHLLSGRLPTLYGGELLRAIGATSRLGCGRSAVALYGTELHGPGETTAQFLARTGTDLEHLLLWQYANTETWTGPDGYPRTAPGHGNAKIDISALVWPGGITALRTQLAEPR